MLLCAVSWVSYRNTEELIAANSRLTRAHRLIEELSALHLLLEDAESGSRGYALSGRRSYLEAYEAAPGKIDATLAGLRHDLSFNTSSLRSIDELERLLRARLEVMTELIAARDHGGVAAAVAIVETSRGKILTDKIRARIAALQSEEHGDLLERERDTRERARQATTAVLATVIVGILLLVAATVIIDRVVRQREKIQAALHNAERVQRAILDSANYSMISTDTSGAIITMNATAEKLLQYRHAELEGESIGRLHDSRELAARAEGLARAMGMPVMAGTEALVAKARYGVPDEAEFTYLRKDGTRFPVLVSVTALRNERSHLSGFLMIASDLSEKQAIQRMKDEFVSVVSHELRTPLTAIKGALGLLAGNAMGTLPDPASRMLQLALNNTERLGRLVNDILDLERIESGRMKMEKRPSSVQDLMAQAAEAVRVMAEEAGVSIAVSPLAHEIYADPDRIVQAFVNLLSNAIKFSPRGSRVDFSAEAANERVVFRIRDYGRGIPAGKLETIFERFEQVDASDAREKGGSGLGLAICRGIVTQHGGSVWAESQTGSGSTFFVRLPLAANSAMAASG